MIEERELFERAVQRFAPVDGSFERLLDRRDRKQRNRRITAGVVALLLAAVVIGAALRAIQTGPPVPVTPTPSPSASNGDVSFVGSNLIDFSDDLNDFGILFAVDPAGGKPRKLLDTECPSDPSVTTSCGRVGIGSVDWAPDGRSIAYTLFESPGSASERDGIYVMDIETGQVRQLTSCTDPVSTRTISIGLPTDLGSGTRSRIPTVAPRPSDTYDGTCHLLYSIASDGTDRVMIPTGSVADPVDPSWSPDGSSIVFRRAPARTGSCTRWRSTRRSRSGSPPTSPRSGRPSRPGRRTARRSPSSPGAIQKTGSPSPCGR